MSLTGVWNRGAKHFSGTGTEAFLNFSSRSGATKISSAPASVLGIGNLFIT